VAPKTTMIKKISIPKPVPIFLPMVNLKLMRWA